MRLYKDVFTGMLYGDPAVGFEFSDEIREIGEIEVKDQKRGVGEVLQAQMRRGASHHPNVDYIITVPYNAKNIKCTYEE